ncbi:MAG: hypothetical protein SO355_07745 [Candidatus Faecousia sp.]|nr:hypothetical protein [Candidatus Faecousia sp.]
MKSTSAYPRTISTPASPNQGEAATPVPPVPETFFREERRKISNEKKNPKDFGLAADAGPGRDGAPLWGVGSCARRQNHH